MRSLILKRMKVLNRSMSVNATSVFKDLDVAKHCLLYMTNNNIVFVCKTIYIQCLLSEVDVENNTYTLSVVSLPKTMAVITGLCTGFLNSTRINANNAR